MAIELNDNHGSGDRTWSEEDVNMTGWMKKVPVMRFSGRPPAAADTLLRTTEIDHGAQKETVDTARMHCMQG